MRKSGGDQRGPARVGAPGDEAQRAVDAHHDSRRGVAVTANLWEPSADGDALGPGEQPNVGRSRFLKAGADRRGHAAVMICERADNPTRNTFRLRS